MDVESQSTILPQVFEDEAFRCMQDPASEHLAEFSFNQSTRSHSSNFHESTGDNDHAQSTPQYAQGSCQVVRHQETPENDCLALLITETMVEKIQEVIDDGQELQDFEKRYSQLGRKEIKAQRDLDHARDELATVASDNGTQGPQQDEVHRQEAVLSEIERQRDELRSRLEIFKSNVVYSQKSAQKFFEDALGAAGLLKLAEVDTHNIEESPEESPKSNSSPGNTVIQSPTSPPSATELLGRATFEEVHKLSNNLAEAQQLYDGLEAKYAEDQVMYNEAVADGDDVPTRSEFDCMFLKYKMGLTTYLIDVEQKYEEERANAIALGVIASDWGTPSEYGSYSAETTPKNDLIKAARRDYTTVLAWMDDVPDLGKAEMTVASNVSEDINLSDERLNHSESIPEPTSMDEWDAKPVEISDSISLIDFGEITGKNIRRWQNQVGHR